MGGTVLRSREHNANGHSLRQVVDGDGKRQHGSLRQVRPHALRLVGTDVQVGRQLVDEQQKAHAHQEAHRSGHHGPAATVSLHLHSGNE